MKCECESSSGANGLILMTYIRFPNVVNHVRLLALQSVAINSKSLQSFLKFKMYKPKIKIPLDVIGSCSSKKHKS